MSVYGYFVCDDCRQYLWLGKAIPGTDPVYYHIGPAEEPLHWKQEQLNQVLWKFLADHTSHHVAIRLEHEMTEEMFGYQEIGGDSEEDISEEEYLKEWPGIERDTP